MRTREKLLRSEKKDEEKSLALSQAQDSDIQERLFVST